MTAEQRIHLHLTPSQRSSLKRRFERHFRGTTTVRYDQVEDITTSVGLTRGCNVQCPFCCVDAPNTITRHMPLEFIDVMREAIIVSCQVPPLINLSLDGDQMSYPYIREVIRKLIDVARCGLITAVPIGTEDEFLKVVEMARWDKDGTLLKDGFDIEIYSGLTVRLSLSRWNEQRLMKHSGIAKFIEGFQIKNHTHPIALVLLDPKLYWEMRMDKEDYSDRGRDRLVDAAIQRATEIYPGVELTQLQYCPDRYSRTLPIFPVLGGDKFGFFFDASGLIFDELETRRTNNLIDFSAGVRNGQISEGTVFLMDSWHASDARREHKRKPNCTVALRDWNLDMDGKLGKMAPPWMGRKGYCKPYVAVDGSGWISSVTTDMLPHPPWLPQMIAD